jgi:hypothetical protein
MSDLGILLERVWLAVSPDGQELAATLRISPPRQQETGEWTSQVTLEQLSNPSTPIHGEDPWQAIELAMKYAAFRVRHFQSIGWRFYWDADDKAAGEQTGAEALHSGVLSHI